MLVVIPEFKINNYFTIIYLSCILHLLQSKSSFSQPNQKLISLAVKFLYKYLYFKSASIFYK